MSSSKYADEGTIAHALAAMCLTEGKPASAYIGRVIKSEDYEHAKLSPSGASRWMRCAGSNALETRIAFKPRSFGLQVTDDMATGVQIYLDNLEKYRAGIGHSAQDAMIEQRLRVDHLTSEEGATGSGDYVLLDYGAAEIQVHDLKFGKGVEVDAEANEQLAMYLSGALRDFEEFAPAGGWKTFRGVIHQPRLNPVPSECVLTLAELRDFEEKCKAAADTAHIAKKYGENWIGKEGQDQYLVPGDKQCKFCDAKATCPALAKMVAKTVFDDFEVLDAPGKPTPVSPVTADNAVLAARWSKIELIEGWCAAIAARAEEEILAGRAVPGLKAVLGRKGSRAWTSKELAEEALKAMRVKHDQMYDYSVISPTSAEKLVKAEVIGERQWKKLLPLIGQADGKPTVVPESDKRPALVIAPVVDDFQTIETTAEELV